ncbi:MAG: cyclic nucleotide-binding domain-containing protein [Patescibacteria group bacterium]
MATIEKLPIFADIDEKRDADLIAKIEIKNVPAGEFIFHEGETDNKLFIVQSGEIEIVRIEDDIAEEIAFLQPGDVFGELGALGQKSRNASARAFSDSTILILDHETTTRFAANLPSFDLLVGKKFLERSKASQEFDYKKTANE